MVVPAASNANEGGYKMFYNVVRFIRWFEVPLVNWTPV